jgi:hypothetical protein
MGFEMNGALESSALLLAQTTKRPNLRQVPVCEALLTGKGAYRRRRNKD